MRLCVQRLEHLRTPHSTGAFELSLQSLPHSTSFPARTQKLALTQQQQSTRLSSREHSEISRTKCHTQQLSNSTTSQIKPTTSHAAEQAVFERCLTFASVELRSRCHPMIPQELELMHPAETLRCLVPSVNFAEKLFLWKILPADSRFLNEVTTAEAEPRLP